MANHGRRCKHFGRRKPDSKLPAAAPAPSGADETHVADA